MKRRSFRTGSLKSTHLPDPTWQDLEDPKAPVVGPEPELERCMGGPCQGPQRRYVLVKGRDNDIGPFQGMTGPPDQDEEQVTGVLPGDEVDGGVLPNAPEHLVPMGLKVLSRHVPRLPAPDITRTGHFYHTSPGRKWPLPDNRPLCNPFCGQPMLSARKRSLRPVMRDHTGITESLMRSETEHNSGPACFSELAVRGNCPLNRGTIRLSCTVLPPCRQEVFLPGNRPWCCPVCSDISRHRGSPVLLGTVV